jgi:ABC-type antimicrobial peptide transport system permease subunit
MFFVYLGRELRRRMRQAAFAALGLAVGIGLVITVTAASAGVRNAQSTVLHSLYGVGTDITVTKAPSVNSGGPFGFRVGQRPGSFTRPKAGTRFTRSTLLPRGLGTLKSSDVSTISAMHGVAAAGGSLDLTDLSVSGTIPSSSSGGGFGGGGPGGGSGGPSNFKVSSFTVTGTDLSAGEVGPLSSAKIVSGRTFTSADANADDAVVDAGYAKQNKLSAGSTIMVGGSKFTVIGVVSQPQGASPPSVYIPLARAQALAGMKDDVNTIYVSADSAADIAAVSKEISSAIPGATVTNSSTLASDVTGSITSAASLANNLGRWLAVAVLAAAFLLASLLMMSAVSHRVREFGTLKALGWPSRRIVGQVMGEAMAIGIAGGVLGTALGLAGAKLVSALAPPLTASPGLATGSATPGGPRAFGPPGGFGGPGGGGGGGGFFHRLFGGGAPLSVHLSAPVTIGAVAIAVVLAIAGGLIAGGFGGWRAARLRPAAALARVQ